MIQRTIARACSGDTCGALTIGTVPQEPAPPERIFCASHCGSKPGVFV